MKRPIYCLGFFRLGRPLFMLLVAILAFGLMIPGLGFYWDDWAKILVSRLYGLSRLPGLLRRRPPAFSLDAHAVYPAAGRIAAALAGL